MATIKAFNRYEVRIYGGDVSRVGLLMCYSSASFVGRIDFYPDGTTLSQDYLWHPSDSRDYIVLQMPMSRFESVISTVRIEKPLHLYIDVDRGTGASTPGRGYLTTSQKEPVGEEEGEGFF
jgi:hypothetical protein